MSTLRREIDQQATWLVRAFQADGIRLDFSLGSFRRLDDFFEAHATPGRAKPGGRLASNLGSILFAIGAYVGETLIRTIPGARWHLDDTDPQGEVNAEIHLPNGSIIWPMQRVMKRFQHGAEDGLLVYGQAFEPLNGTLAASAGPISKPSPAKPWYKFW